MIKTSVVNRRGAKLNPNDDQQFLTFLVGDREYAVDIMSVREICVWVPPHPLPGVPDYVSGVINLRGNIIPLIDLRIKLGAKNAEDKNTVVIVLKERSNKNSRLIGLVVDRVKEIHFLAKKMIQKAPNFIQEDCSEYLSGMFNDDDRVVMILDSEYVLKLSRRFGDESMEKENV